MAVMGFQMATNTGFESTPPGALPVEYPGIGWNDSSWELMRGLEVVEDLPPDAWAQAAPGSHDAG